MDFFGLDIGTYSIKAVQLRKTQEKFYLVAFGSAPSTSRGLLSEAESDLTALAEAIKKLHKEAKFKTRNVAATLPQHEVFTRVVTLPELTQDELESALKWEAEQYVPIPLEEVTLVHQIMGKLTMDGKEKMEILLVAAPNRLIDKVVKVLKSADLNPVSLETEIFALARSLIPADKEPVMIVDLGATATDFAIVEKDQLVFVHSIGTAGSAITRAVAMELGLDPSQAEAYKKAYGVDPGKLEGKVLGAIGPVLEVIVKEMEKAIQYYQAKGGGRTLSRVILTGGSAGLPEVAGLLAKRLNLEIQLGDPFVRVGKDNLPVGVPANEASAYAVAVGLAMKEIG